MRSYRFIVLCLCSLGIVLTGIAFAQTSSGTISGHVVDQSGGIVTKAKVRLVNQQTAVQVTTQVRSNGDFVFADVQPGTFGQMNGTLNPRELQLALRINF